MFGAKNDKPQSTPISDTGCTQQSNSSSAGKHVRGTSKHLVREWWCGMDASGSATSFLLKAGVAGVRCRREFRRPGVVLGLGDAE